MTPPPIHNLDELIERAQRGRVARDALEYLREKISALREETYRKLLNAPPDRVLDLRADLRAIERLAQVLLNEEAQGELAYRQLCEVAPPEERPLTVARVARKKTRPADAGERR